VGVAFKSTLTDVQREALLTIKANTLECFAQELLCWVKQCAGENPEA